ncbi:MAG: vWA domain-containing protein [Chthoniobacterales bacterium]
MSFAVPEWFFALLTLPLLAILFVVAERKSAQRLREFVAPRLLPQLTSSVDRFRRALRFSLQLLALCCAIAALAQPRWGYSFEDVTRKGIDLLIAVDTSRSMLSNDVQPNRLQRVKLAATDLITELQGDRVGLIAFAGRAFLQAPLTIDYDAAVEAINDLDTQTIPEGGTNISEAITLASQTFGKTAVGNRALVIFTDGEELSGEATKAAKAAADAGIRIFAVGVGTAQGSLIPVPEQDGGTAFVKDPKGQVVKSKLDEQRLQEIAKATGGFYLHLENGPRTMHQLAVDGLRQLTAQEMDVRLNRRPIERYEWPLGAAALMLATSFLIGDRRRARARRGAHFAGKLAPAAAAILFAVNASANTDVEGLKLYQDGKFADAYRAFEGDLNGHPRSSSREQMQFDAGAAAYKLRDYDKAAQAFSQALLSTDAQLQSKSHFNLGNTLYQRGETIQNREKKVTDWTNALQHYEQALKLDPGSKDAKENYAFVAKKIEQLKNEAPSSEQASSQKPLQPSEAAKQAKAQADKAVLRRDYHKALEIMTNKLMVDPSVGYYGDYIQRLKDINGIKKTDTA